MLLLFVPLIGFSQVNNQFENFNLNLDNVPKNILNNFSFKKDKFTNFEIISLKENDSRRLQFYFISNQGKGTFVIQISYLGSDWIFLNSIVFLIENKTFEYKLNNIKRETIYGKGISETTTININDELFNVLLNIINTKSDVNVRFGGEKSNFDFKINRYMKENIKQTLEFYRLITN